MKVSVSTLLKDARGTVEKANFCLDDKVVNSIEMLYGAAGENSSGKLGGKSIPCNPKASPDSLPMEYYQIVAANGEDTGVRLGNKPTIDCWIKKYNGTLLVSHWLAHVLGLRHRSVHLFLGSSKSEDLTYLQLRSFSLSGHGGKLDVAVGGHVADCEDPEDTLKRELIEELGLNVEQHVVGGRCHVKGRYEHHEYEKAGKYREIELRSVYMGILTPSGEQEIKIRKGEVAGVVLIYKDELQRMLETFPDFIASGLSGSSKFLL